MDYFTINIRKRKFFGWLFVIVWIIIVILSFEIAFGSLQEREMRAATIMFIFASGILIFGIVFALLRNRKLKRIKTEAEEIKRLENAVF